MEILNIMIAAVFISGWFGGKLFERLRLPPVLGMMLFGMLLGPFARTHAPQIFWDIAPFLKSTALMIILLRAGLGIRKEALAKSGVTAVFLSVIPCLSEGIVLTAVFSWFWGFDFFTAVTAAFLLSAVSTAVVVPSMLNLMETGHGKENEVPTSIIAGASVDNVTAITLFTIFLSLAEPAAGTAPVNAAENLRSSIFMQLAAIPLGLLGAVVSGIIIGLLLAAYFRRRYEKIRATEKFLLLLAVSIMFAEIGNYFHLAALLGIMTIGFVLVEKTEHIAHELAQKLSKAWIFAEILLFVLIGLAVDPVHAASVGLKGAATIGIGLLARSAGVLAATLFSPFTWKEKLFCVLAYLPKATVQAALGSVPLAAGIEEGETILSIAVLAILLTAPLGLSLIRRFGPRLLASADFSSGSDFQDGSDSNFQNVSGKG